MKRIGLLGLAVLGGCLWQEIAHAQLTGNLTVQVENLRNQEGNLCLKVFSASRGFPNDNDSAVERTCVAIASISPENPDDPLRYTFENLTSGTYAVAIYHDRNSDEVLNRGAFGAPTEGYGFSNDAPADIGPARFEDAIFLVAGPETTVQIQMRYPN
ncbi:DUF2141 domain-containing protein [Oscillatoria sp. FACHB-1407]|uniref:DUF2141 domain-containing protein n=1 Tax=Oscillatoria sp. FACHB-1407 TaxID=2692847 RepID=UPI0016865441|nr:DUF2141 domain-containing protein [Oscillatoria sp. FACHB-1407]MBD2459959.1 DUF2141 domain-containing protein [Oscillatoria sp. FACHB-1407]